MMEEEFWGLIAKAGQAGAEAFSDTLSQELERMSAPEIMEFHLSLRKKMVLAYRWDLWAAAYLIMDGCSDDSFEYFRAWLITQGKTVFEKALKDPDTLSEIEIDEDPDQEDLLYLAPEAYEEKTGKEMPNHGMPDPAEPKGRPWKEEAVENLFPKLAAKYVED